jgi:hypothetical protein
LISPQLRCFFHLRSQPVPLDSEIIVVSGLPRSGTSLMMQMLHAGGVPMLSDDVRAADIDNPRGYFEFEPAKRLKSDASWLPAARGRAIKIISQLLYDLPLIERYRLIFMERPLDEIILSQDAMLKRNGRATVDQLVIKRGYEQHLAGVHRWIAVQERITRLDVKYSALLADPQGQATRVNEFLDNALAIEPMASAVDTSLYRNRI